jgi:hypothetical protein
MVKSHESAALKPTDMSILASNFRLQPTAGRRARCGG